MENLARALVQAGVLAITSRQSGQGTLLKAMALPLKAMSDEEAGALRAAVLEAVVQVEPDSPQEQALELLEESWFGDDT